MKIKFLFLALIFAISSGKAQERELQEITKLELLTFIEEAKKAGKITEDPLVVINEETILELKEIGEDRKFFGEVVIINKGNQKMAELYGERAVNGIILIGSGYNKIKEEKILFFIGKKEVSRNFLQRIYTDSIKSVTVIKNKEEIARFTDKECDGIVIIDAPFRK